MYALTEYPGSVALFMPAHNEEPNLPTTVASAVEHLKNRGVSYEVIVVNDGSTDGTAAVADELAMLFDCVRVVHHQKNLGYGAALRTGFRAALESDLDYIAFCDSDGQFDISSLDELFGVLVSEGADVSVGYRLNRADGMKRKMMGRGWHHASTKLLGFHVLDVDCGFKLFSRDAMLKLEPLLTGNYATISPEVLVRAHRAGFKIAEAGIAHMPRQAGEQSGANIRVVYGSFKGLWLLRSSLAQEASYG